MAPMISKLDLNMRMLDGAGDFAVALRLACGYERPMVIKYKTFFCWNQCFESVSQNVIEYVLTRVLERAISEFVESIGAMFG
jgi:hypothetical protein